MPIHVDYALTYSQLPDLCIADCSAPGSIDDVVAYWREELGFTVNRKLALRYLQDQGAWERDELAAENDETLAERILWLACGDFREWVETNGNSGSDVFFLT